MMTPEKVQELKELYEYSKHPKGVIDGCDSNINFQEAFDKEAKSIFSILKAVAENCPTVCKFENEPDSTES